MADNKRSRIYCPSVLKRLSTKNWFIEFAAYREDKANLPLPLDVQKLKAFHLQGALPP